MTTVLVYIEAFDGAVSAASIELIAAAQALVQPDGSVEALVAAADPAGLASRIRGVDRILTVTHPALSPYTPAAHARVLAQVVSDRRPDLVLVGYTSTGLDLGPALAVVCDLPLVSYCSRAALEGGAVATESQIYGGKLIAAVRTQLPAVLAITPGSYREDAIADRPATTVEIAPPAGLDSTAVRFVGARAPDPDAVDISQAERLVCVGRGIGDADSIDLARDVAGKLDAEIAGSRPVIDAGWLPKERQVGKSGRRVKPRLYLAVGVSGAPEHLEGMSAAELVIAVNSDPRAPIFDHAHYGTTLDLFDLLEALGERLEAGGA